MATGRIIAVALLSAMLVGSSAMAYNDDEHTRWEDIPKLTYEHVLHSEDNFQEFLDLMMTASDARHAYKLARDKFGPFPLRFSGSNFAIAIISLRDWYLSVSCMYPMIRIEHSIHKAEKGSLLDSWAYRGPAMEWMFVYPRTAIVMYSNIFGNPVCVEKMTFPHL